MSTVGRDESVILDYIRIQEKEDDRLEQLKLGDRKATGKVANRNVGPHYDPAQPL